MPTDVTDDGLKRFEIEDVVRAEPRKLVTVPWPSSMKAKLNPANAIGTVTFDREGYHCTIRRCGLRLIRPRARRLTPSE